jgi:hypothetical protein
MKIMRGVAAMLAMGALAACAQNTGLDGPADPAARDGVARTAPTGRPAVQPRWTSCAAALPPGRTPDEDTSATVPIDLPRLGDGFTPVAAMVCARENRRRADGGEDLVATEGRATDIAALVAALRLPDAAPTTQACTDDLPMVPWFALVDARGRWVRPGTPADECGKIRTEVRTAVRAVTLAPVSAHAIRETVSAGAAAAGCEQDWSDMIAASPADGPRPAVAAPAPYTLAGEIRLCVYRVPAGEQGSAKPVGGFVHGGVLPAGKLSAVAARVRSLRPAAACRRPAGLFATLMPTGENAGRGSVYVELDGCRRVLRENADEASGLVQGDPTLVALLQKT